jgi:hypothetical protein
MAIADNAVWEIRTTGTSANANGGFFVPGSSGVDYSQQNAAQYNLTGATTAASSATVAHASAAADMVGNGAHIISGTNFTPGFYQIISVVVGVSLTLDRVCTTAAGAAGVINIGGALSLGGTVTGSSDTDVFNSARPGHIYYIKSGTYTLGANLTLSSTVGGSISNPAKMIGYQTARNDNPLTTGRPVLNTSTFSWSHNIGQFWNLSYLEFTGSPSTTVHNVGQGSIVRYCKFTNSSGTAGRTALSLSGANCMLIDSECISAAGIGITVASSCHVLGSYIHGSVTGFTTSATINGFSIEGCVFENNTTAITTSAAMTAICLIKDNTLFGSATPSGTGINMSTTGTGNIRIINNIIYGFVTGVTHADATNNCFGDFNCYFNNTTNRTNFVTGANDSSLTPNFAGVGNYSPGTNIRSIGYPQTWPGLTGTTGFPTIGAVRRSETASQPTESTVVSGTSYDSGNRTGTFVSVTAAQLWDTLTSTITTVGSIGKQIKDNLDTTVSTRLPTSSYTTPPTTTQIKDAVATDDRTLTVGKFIGLKD